MAERNQQRLLSIRETVKQYGGTPWLWRSRIWARDLPFVQIGKKHYFDRHDLDAFIERCKVTA